MLLEDIAERYRVQSMKMSLAERSGRGNSRVCHYVIVSVSVTKTKKQTIGRRPCGTDRIVRPSSHLGMSSYNSPSSTPPSSWRSRYTPAPVLQPVLLPVRAADIWCPLIRPGTNLPGQHGPCVPRPPDTPRGVYNPASCDPKSSDHTQLGSVYRN